MRPPTRTPFFRIHHLSWHSGAGRIVHAPEGLSLVHQPLKVFFNFRYSSVRRRWCAKAKAPEALGFRGGVQALSHLWGHSLDGIGLSNFKSCAVQTRKNFSTACFFKRISEKIFSRRFVHLRVH
jgi:hypothetical protein